MSVVSRIFLVRKQGSSEGVTGLSPRFLKHFGIDRKEPINIIMSVRPSAWISAAPIGRISVTLECLDSYENYLLTYLLTPWSRVLLEKLTGSAASQEIPRIFGTLRFLTVLTSYLLTYSMEQSPS